MAETLKRSERKDWFYSYNMIFELDVSPQAKLIYLYLCRCADGNSQSFPSKNTIAEKCNVSVTAVKTALKELIGARLLTKEEQRRSDGSQTSNLYTIFSEPYEKEEVEELVSDRKVQDEASENDGSEYAYPRSKYAPSRSECDPHPVQNTTSPQSKYAPQEVLPIRSTTHKKDLSVCQTEDIQILEEIKKSCELHIFHDKEVTGVLEDAIEKMFFAKYITVNGANIPQSIVRKNMQKLSGAVLAYGYDSFKNGTGAAVKNSGGYLLSCIYNAITEYHTSAVVNITRDTG